VSLLNTIILYAKNMQKTASFYQQYFGFEGGAEVIDGLMELTHPQGGVTLLIHQAARSVKGGNAGLKLMFDVQDVEAFKQASAEKGLVFGATHQAKGYIFANVKDPDGNSISISSRNFRIQPE
jgi:predicted enzyme related to lactoylglutathione lyase